MPLSLCCRASTLITTTTTRTEAGGGQGRVRCSSRGNRSIHSIHTQYSLCIHRVFTDMPTPTQTYYVNLYAWANHLRKGGLPPHVCGWECVCAWPGATSCSVSLTLTHARANVMQICSVRVCKLLYALLPYKNSVIFKWVFRKK